MDLHFRHILLLPEWCSMISLWNTSIRYAFPQVLAEIRKRQFLAVTRTLVAASALIKKDL